MEAVSLHELQAPSPFTMASKAISLCLKLLDWIVQCFVRQPLADHTRDAVQRSLQTMRRIVHWSARAASGPRPVTWYSRGLLTLCLMIVRTGAELGARLLDIQLPENQNMVMYLQNVEAAIIRRLESWSRNPPFPEQPPNTDTGASSSVSSTSNYANNSDAEPFSPLRIYELHLSAIEKEHVTEPQTQLPKRTYNRADLAAQPMDLDKEGTVEMEDDKRNDSAENVHEAKAEEQHLAITADAPATIAAALQSLMCADDVTMSEGRQPATQPASASSRDLLVAEGSSREGSGSSRLVQKTTFKAKARSKTLKGIKVKLNPAS